MFSMGPGGFRKKNHRPPKWIGPLLAVFFVLLMLLLWLKGHS